MKVPSRPFSERVFRHHVVKDSQLNAGSEKDSAVRLHEADRPAKEFMVYTPCVNLHKREFDLHQDKPIWVEQDSRCVHLPDCNGREIGG